MKTMLDKCAVAGDITQAIDRRGAWSCAVTVIGGAENTAVKLQSADSADGEFTDFKTLISADEAEADQYKGFVLDLSGAGNFIKIVGATMATCVLGDCDADVKKVAIKAGEIPSGADLEDNKTATIDVSTYTEPVEIEPTEGKDGMKKATVTLSNIPNKQFYIYHYENGSSSLLCEASSFEDMTVGMKGVMSSASSECITGVACTEKTDESAIFSKDNDSITIESSDVPTPLSSILD
mgnify:CR=1 FL=1